MLGSVTASLAPTQHPALPRLLQERNF